MTLYNHEIIADYPNPDAGGSWDYYGGGYSVGQAIDYTNTVSASQVRDVRDNFYFARLGELTGQDSFFNLDWVPTYGNYNGNGSNDAWVRWQAWNDIYGDGRQLVRGPEDAQYIREALAAYEARYPNSDPLGLKPVDQTDRNGLEHDLNSFGGAVRDVANNITYAVGNFVQTLMTGNLYALASVPFIGALASVYHTAQGIVGAVGAVGGGLASAGSSLFGGFSGALSNLASGNFSGAISSFVSGVSNAFSALGDALSNAFKALFPVVVDLDGDGVELLSVSQADLRIDIGGGDYRQSGWVGPDDGLIAFDANGNGIVDGYAEFGLTSFSEGANTDLEALAIFDSNGDGVFDAKDELFGQFLVWRDVNGDGIAQEGEAVTLSDAGIISIALALNGEAGSDAGNFVANTTVATFDNGVVRKASDVAFASSGASDSARMLAVGVTSHSLGEGLEVVTIASGAGAVILGRDILADDTEQLIVAASPDGGQISVSNELATTFLGAIGDDIFVGGDAGSTFMGGGGENIFIGGKGRDTYVVDQSSKGSDLVLDRGGADTFVLSGEFTFQTERGDLMIESADGGYAMRIVDWRTQGQDDVIMLNGDTLDLHSMMPFPDDQTTSSLGSISRETDWFLAA